MTNIPTIGLHQVDAVSTISKFYFTACTTSSKQRDDESANKPCRATHKKTTYSVGKLRFYSLGRFEVFPLLRQNTNFSGYIAEFAGIFSAYLRDLNALRLASSRQTKSRHSRKINRFHFIASSDSAHAVQISI